MKVDVASVSMIPKSMCDCYRAICLRAEKDIIEGAMYDPNDKFAKEYIKMRTGYQFVPKVAC